MTNEFPEIKLAELTHVRTDAEMENLKKHAAKLEHYWMSLGGNNQAKFCNERLQKQNASLRAWAKSLAEKLCEADYDEPCCSYTQEYDMNGVCNVHQVVTELLRFANEGKEV